MKSKHPDAYPWESEEEYQSRKQEEELQQRDSSTGVFEMFLTISILLLHIAAVFGVFIYAGYLLSLTLLGEETDKVKIWGFALLFTYLIFCIIYFLKGIIIGLRTRNLKLWILPWVICVLLCCIFPAYIIKSLVTGMFHVTKRQDIFCILISWGAFLLSLLYIYSIYQFKTPTAPRILYWSYVLGLKVCR